MNPIAQLYREIDESGLWEKSVVLRRGEFLKESGTTDTHVYYVESGSLRVFVQQDDVEYTIRFGYTGNLFVALDSFVTGKPSELCIQAIRKSELRVISGKSFRSFIHASHERLILWNAILEQLVLQQLERETDLLVDSPAERYRRVLSRSPRLFQEIPGRYIASYLRMTPETFSRLKKS
jgi:CRP/FNR family transcriptional regulator, anaerobic regulatory protein